MEDDIALLTLIIPGTFVAVRDQYETECRDSRAPRGGDKALADMVQSHQNALLSCVLQGELGELCAGEMLTLSLCCHHWPYGRKQCT